MNCIHRRHIVIVPAPANGLLEKITDLMAAAHWIGAREDAMHDVDIDSLAIVRKT